MQKKRKKDDGKEFSLLPCVRRCFQKIHHFRESDQRIKEREGAAEGAGDEKEMKRQE